MRKLLASAVAALGILSSVAHAQDFPSKPITLVVPFSAGGSTDVLGRLLAENLGTRLGQPIVVDNRPGAGTNIGAATVASAVPDGYTLLMGSSTQAINVSLYSELPYDLKTQLVAVSPVASSPSILVVHPSVEATTIGELIALAKEDPGGLTYASSGNGSTAHLAGEIFKKKAGIDITHIPYKGAGPALNDLLGGHVQMMFGFTAGALPLIHAGELRPLAVTSSQRLPDLPDVPTLQEAGVEGYEVNVWYGLLAPAGTPEDIVSRLNAETAEAARELSDRFAELGVYPMFLGSAEFSTFIDEEVDRWSEAVESSGARVD